MGCYGGGFGVGCYGGVGGVGAPILLGTPLSYGIPTTQSTTPVAAVVATAAAVRSKTCPVAKSSKSLEMEGDAEVGGDAADIVAEVFGILALSSGQVQSKDATRRPALDQALAPQSLGHPGFKNPFPTVLLMPAPAWRA
jgi:hypothetical protein